MKYFASVSYDGSKFYGFQRLEDYDTVQKELERALGIINKNFVAVKGAGRTDRGVHAYSQGVCFELNGSVPTEKLKDVINRVLNNYVHINYVEEVSDDFHPRFDAKMKKYEYVINLGEFDPIISDDSDEKAKDQDKLDSVEGNDAELEKKQTDAAESKDTNDSASNQLTNDSDAEENKEEVKKNTLVDEDASSEAAQNPDTEEQEVLRAQDETPYLYPNRITIR